MDCYKLIITEDRFGNNNSQAVLYKLLNEIFPGRYNPTDEYGFMYENTNTFPKEYYFNTMKESILDKLETKYLIMEAVYPSDVYIYSPYYLYLGNNELFFPSKI